MEQTNLTTEDPACHHYGLYTHHPNALQLYSANTPNGMKISLMLEELMVLRVVDGDVMYEAHTINLTTKPPETRLPQYLKINLNGKIPALYDPISKTNVFESGAILVYLAEKYHELLPSTGALRYDILKWTFWACTGLSTSVKAFGFFYKFCKHDEPYAIQRNAQEVTRLLLCLENHLAAEPFKHWIAGDLYSIADISAWPWIDAIVSNYPGSDVYIKMDDYPNVINWMKRIQARPACQRAYRVTPL